MFNRAVVPVCAVAPSGAKRAPPPPPVRGAGGEWSPDGAHGPERCHGASSERKSTGDGGDRGHPVPQQPGPEQPTWPPGWLEGGSWDPKNAGVGGLGWPRVGVWGKLHAVLCQVLGCRGKKEESRSMARGPSPWGAPLWGHPPPRTLFFSPKEPRSGAGGTRGGQRNAPEGGAEVRGTQRAWGHSRDQTKYQPHLIQGRSGGPHTVPPLCPPTPPH